MKWLSRVRAVFGRGLESANGWTILAMAIAATTFVFTIMSGVSGGDWIVVVGSAAGIALCVLLAALIWRYRSKRRRSPVE